MAELFRLITPITYWILIGLWSFILYFYVKKMWDSKTKQLFQALVIILAIDAFRTLFESFYFGLWYTSLSGLLPLQIGDFLTRPELVIIPKIINVVAAIIIIVLLLKRWLPKEEQEQDRLGVALHNSEEEFKAFFENNPLSCWIEDFSEVQNYFEDLREKGISDIESYFDENPEEVVKLVQAIKIKDVNQATLDLHKAENKEQLYQGLEKTFTSESFAVFRKEMVDLWNGHCQGSYDGLVKTLDDEFRYIQMNYRVIPGYENTLEKVLVTLVDNTAKWMVEQNLLVSENRLNLAMQFTNDGLYDWNLKTKEIYYSPGWKRMLGYRVDELPDDFTVWEKLTHPDDVKVSWQMLNDVIEGKRSSFELEFRMKHKNGNWVEILSRSNVDINNAGKAIRVVGTHVDITARKKYEKQLKVLSSAIENSLNGFDIVNAEGELIYVNKAFLAMYGYDRAGEIIGTSPVNLCADSHIPEKIIQTLQEKGECVLEHVAKKRDGSTFDVLMYARLAHDELGNQIYPTSSIDITERKKTQIEKEKLERQLHQAQKMESIGNLAGGIAHEFNNMLAIIMGNNELVMEDLPQGSLARESTEEIRIAGLRARDVVKQLLTFSRQDDAVKNVMDFKKVVQESMKLIRSSTPVNIKIEQILSADTYPVIGNETQINQILINLCNNAVDALPEKDGVITVKLLNETIDTQQTKHQIKINPGQYAKLIVSDNGSGMDTEILDRIFDPFFTTKDIGEGTGIGMAVVHGIVERHGGTIIVDSKPDRGTTFTIFLPAHEGLMERDPDERESIPVGNEHILYVDDETSIAILGKRLLERLGYTTESTTDPEEALDMVRSNPNKFDLLITDMAMPNMTGDQLVIETLKIRQDMPTIICTGYSAKISEKEAADIGVHSYLMKPINKSELAKIVRKVLDGAKRSNLEEP